MNLRQIFLEYAQQSLDEDLDLSWLPEEDCGWFFWMNIDRLKTEPLPCSVWPLRNTVKELIESGALERHPDNKHFVRLSCGTNSN